MRDDAKLDRLDAYLGSNDLGSVWFATPPMFAWLTGGSNLIAREGAVGAAAAGYDGEEVTVVTSNIEGERLREEEVGPTVRVVEHPWHERGIDEAVADVATAPVATDFECADFARVDQSTLTQPLTDTDVEQYRDLAVETATAVEAVAQDASPGDTEQTLAARLHYELQRRGVESPVVLVGGDERLQRYRHFTPTDSEVGRYAVLTVVGARHGRTAAVTRTVAFDGAPDWLETRYRDVCRVAATAAAATRHEGVSGGSAGDVFEAIQNAYGELGYENEWENHHQGGALGYASREWVATPDHDASIELPATFGWNPTVEGVKTEDTILTTGDGVEVLSTTGEFPTVTVEAVGFEAELTLPGVRYS